MLLWYTKRKFNESSRKNRSDDTMMIPLAFKLFFWKNTHMYIYNKLYSANIKPWNITFYLKSISCFFFQNRYLKPLFASMSSSLFFGSQHLRPRNNAWVREDSLFSACAETRRFCIPASMQSPTGVVAGKSYFYWLPPQKRGGVKYRKKMEKT